MTIAILTFSDGDASRVKSAPSTPRAVIEAGSRIAGAVVIVMENLKAYKASEVMLCFHKPSAPPPGLGQHLHIQQHIFTRARSQILSSTTLPVSCNVALAAASITICWCDGAPLRFVSRLGHLGGFGRPTSRRSARARTHARTRARAASRRHQQQQHQQQQQ